MRQRLCTTWLMLTLIPYLCFAMLGEIPHTHEHGHATFVFHVQHFAGGSGQQASITQDDNDDDCALCKANSIHAASTTLTAFTYALPQVTLPRTINAAQAPVRVLPALASSRAPPTALS